MNIYTYKYISQITYPISRTRNKNLKYFLNEKIVFKWEEKWFC